MSEIVCRESAESEVQLWAEHFGVTLDLPDRERIVRAVMDGRLSFDDVAETFIYRLRKPVTLENGDTLSELRINEPSTGKIRDANKITKDEFEVSVRLLSYVTGHPLGIIDRICMRDLTTTGTLFGFFG